MKARILNDKFEGIYTDDFIQKNLNNIINNQIVSDWFLTDILPNKNELNYIKLMFDSQNYYEGATFEEISEYQRSLVPQIITRRQFKIALAILGKNENDILNGINQLPEPTKTIANISYKEAGTFERSNSELIFVAKTFLQLTDEQIDEIFIKGNEF